jgi:hypothetical protein
MSGFKKDRERSAGPTKINAEGCRNVHGIVAAHVVVAGLQQWMD